MSLSVTTPPTLRSTRTDTLFPYSSLFRSTAPARQDRAVDVEAAVARGIEDRPRQDQAVCRDHRDVEVEGGEFGLRLGVFQALRRADRQAMPLGPEVVRATLPLLAAL